MKALIIISLFLCQNSYSQYYKVNIATEITEDFQVEIDSQLQSVDFANRYSISFIPKGIRTLKLLINKKNTPSVKIGTTSGPVENYIVRKLGNEYKIENLSPDFKFSKNIYPYTTSYRKRIIPKPIDSSLLGKTCKVNDSTINEIVINLGLLTKEKAKTDYIDNVLKYKCLNMSQIKSIAYRLPKDELKFEYLKKSFQICYDSKNYADLSSIFETQEYSNKMLEWVKGKK